MPLLLLALFLLIFTAQAADPDPIQDFCVPRAGGMNRMCKASADASDFTSTQLRNITNLAPLPQGGFAAQLVSNALFPGLTTMGLSLARAELGPKGVVPLHTHPRSSELLYVAEGVLEAGFVDTNNTLYAELLHKGDMFIVPRALIHYQFNPGPDRAAVVAAFNSEDPGLIIFGPSLYGSGIRDEVLNASIQMDQPEIDALRRAYKPS